MVLILVRLYICKTIISIIMIMIIIIINNQVLNKIKIAVRISSRKGVCMINVR